MKLKLFISKVFNFATKCTSSLSHGEFRDECVPVEFATHIPQDECIFERSSLRMIKIYEIFTSEFTNFYHLGQLTKYRVDTKTSDIERNTKQDQRGSNGYKYRREKDE